MSQIEEQPECPLCMELLEVDDLNFFPCTCGYQICRFCWHRIRTDENGLCPACRKAYPENPADFKPLSQEQVVKMKAEKRHKEQQKKQKATESRKHLANVRVVQKNLVFVVGLPMRLADTQMLKRNEYFGKFGRIHKVVINQSTTYAGAMGPSASAYVTYSRCDDALRAIEAVNNISVDSRVLKTSLGTTKYCSHFIKSQSCPKPDCMYLHDFGDSEASFTKEEMQQGKHQEYEKKLHEQLNLFGTVERKTASPPQGAKQETWPSLNINVVPVEGESKPAPPPLSQVTAPASGKSKRHGKDKSGQDKGKRKGKEKSEKSDGHALGTSQSESCIPSNRIQSTNYTNRSSLIFDDTAFYSIATNSSNSGEEIKQINGFEEDISPPDSLDEVDNWDSKPGSPIIEPIIQPTHVNNGHTHNSNHVTDMHAPAQSAAHTHYLTHNGYHETPSQSPSPRSLPTPPSPPPEYEAPDDELDFDPFQETQKGLADLLEKELALQQKVAEAKAATQNCLPPSLYLHNYQHQPPPMDPAILSHLHSNHHRVAPTNRLDRRPLPPPGFGGPSQMSQVQQSISHTHPHMDLYSRGMNGTKPPLSYYYPNGNGVSKFTEWPESLRNLVHDNSHLHHHSQHSPQTSYHRPEKVWNAPSSFADWTTLDPAIVSSSRPHNMGINVHSPPPLYNQGMSGVNGSPMSLNCLGPNLSYRYQDAYYKTHIHNTSVPPPGFSLLHQSGNGLKQSLSSGIETMD